jgi:hypothetical protein
MSPFQSTRYLMQFLRWIQRAVIWRRMARFSDSFHSADMIRQTAAWAKADFGKWKLATFGA